MRSGHDQDPGSETRLMGRRALLMAMTSLAVVGPQLSFPGTPAAAPLPAAFSARRNGSPIGSHRLEFVRNGDLLLVYTSIACEVKVAFFTVYYYQHHSRETWKGGRLTAIDSRTDDNGRSSSVKGRAVGDSFEVNGSSGKLTLPADVAPSSFWSEAMAKRGEWLDVQDGKIVRSTVSPQPREMLRLGNRTVPATCYALKGDVNCNLWYHEGEWVRLMFAARDGSTIEYMREPLSA